MKNPGSQRPEWVESTRRIRNAIERQSFGKFNDIESYCSNVHNVSYTDAKKLMHAERIYSSLVRTLPAPHPLPSTVWQCQLLQVLAPEPDINDVMATRVAIAWKDAVNISERDKNGRIDVSDHILVEAMAQYSSPDECDELRKHVENVNHSEVSPSPVDHQAVIEHEFPEGTSTYRVQAEKIVNVLEELGYGDHPVAEICDRIGFEGSKASRAKVFRCARSLIHVNGKVLSTVFPIRTKGMHVAYTSMADPENLQTTPRANEASRIDGFLKGFEERVKVGAENTSDEGIKSFNEMAYFMTAAARKMMVSYARGQRAFSPRSTEKLSRKAAKKRIDAEPLFEI